MARTWQLQDAKSKLSKVVNQALNEGPQIITRHGDQVVVVISYEEYTRLLKPSTDLVDFFRASPLVGIDLDLERDHSPLRQDLDL